jgi:hypothetical protein
MVLVEPVVEEPVVAAATSAAGVNAIVVTTQLEASAAPAQAASSIEDILAEGAAMLPDGTPARVALPPPLPASVTKLNAAAGATSSSTLFLASVAMGLICLAAIAWAAWSYFGDPTVDVATASVDSDPAESGEPDRTATSTAADNSDLASAAPTVESSATEQPKSSGDSAGNVDSQSDKTSAAVEASPGAVPHSALRQPASDETSDKSEPASDQTRSNEAPPNAAAPADKPEAGAVRKPSLEIHDLPKASPPLESAPSATNLASQRPVQPQEDNGENVPASDAADSPSEKDGPTTPVLHRIAPREVDVDVRLATKVVAVEFQDAALHQALETLADLAGITVSIDVDALFARGISVDHPVNLAARSTTIADVFAQALSPIGLVAEEQQGQLVVVPRLGNQARKVRYSIDDLLRSGDPSIDELAASGLLARASMATDGALELAKDAFFLVGTETQHADMIELCEKLRVARGRPLRSRYNVHRPDSRFDPRRFELATRRSKAQDLLAKRITAGIGQPASLRDVVKYLARETGSTILLDGPALAEAGLSIETEAVLSAEDLPLEAALDQLLKPLELTYCAIAEDVLQITTMRAAAFRQCVEIYRNPLPSPPAPHTINSEDLLDKLVVAAGIENADAAMFYDPPSQCLIVVASYPIQVRLERAMKSVVDAGHGPR